MKHLNRFATTALATLAASLTLAGCNMGSFPEASVNPEQTSLGTISGSNFGGHAPLVGAHVYVLQPNATGSGSNGYGGQATSILNTNNTANGANNPNAIQNSSDPNIPTSWYYQLTDSTGSFNITGDYTCTVGLPVYLYLYGGSPTYPSANNNFNISNIVWTAATSSTIPTTGYFGTFTINTSTSQNIENAYIGELFGVNFSGAPPTGTALTGAGGTYFNNTLQVVSATNLTTTTFSVSEPSLPPGVTVGTNYPQTGTGQVTFLPTFNPAIVNLASLGICPSGGFTGANKINFVYVNEVSTVATAYAYRGFTLQSNNDATHIGTSTTNIAGLQNAATIAAQLYDIQGGNVSTTYAGEGHTARTQTIAGNGIVPQANIDTLGNILAACVDSANGSTTVGTSGSYSVGGTYSGISSQCNTLFQNATNTGIPTTSTGSGANAPGTQPYDIATAAINIARHPAGPPYSYTGSTGTSAFVTALYSLPTGNVPFAPYLTNQPNDFTIGIAYTAAKNPASTGGSYTQNSETVAIDKIGNVWVVANNGGSPYYFYEMSPAGVISNVNYQTTWQYGGVVIDSNESAWAASATDRQPVTYVKATSTPVAAAGTAPVTYTYAAGATNSTKNTYYSYSSVADSLGNIYFGNAGLTANYNASSSPNDYIAAFSASSPTGTGVESGSMTGINNYSAISFLNGSIQPYASGSGRTSAFFEYNAYVDGQVEIDSVQLSSSTGTVITSGGTPVNDTGFPVYGINTNGSPGTNTFAQTPTPGCTSLLNAGKLTTTRSGDAIVPDFHDGSGGLNSANSSLYYINRGTGTSGTCTQISGATLEAGINSGWASTLDGNDYVYIISRTGTNTIDVINTQSGTAAGTVAISPSTGYYPQYYPSGSTTLTDMLTGAFGAAVGPSGEIWVPNNDSSGLVEIIGLGTPTTTPFSVAASPTNDLVGYRP